MSTAVSPACPSATATSGGLPGAADGPSSGAAAALAAAAASSSEAGVQPASVSVLRMGEAAPSALAPLAPVRLVSVAFASVESLPTAAVAEADMSAEFATTISTTVRSAARPSVTACVTRSAVRVATPWSEPMMASRPCSCVAVMMDAKTIARPAMSTHTQLLIPTKLQAAVPPRGWRALPGRASMASWVRVLSVSYALEPFSNGAVTTALPPPCAIS